MRIFVALFLPDPVRDALVAALESVRATGSGVSWVRPQNLHYTLRFLGELGEDGARRVAEAADEAAGAHRVFELALGSFGCFPPKGPPRVLWVGAGRGAEPLEALARDLERGLRGRGFDPGDHPFRAHLTIGRVREPGRGDWRHHVEELSVEAPPFQAERLSVVQSTLSPRGSLYDIRHEARLRD